ncbi:MAG TPA: DUF4160 domain-containing protein [Actinomycetota bacterium]
MPELSRFYGIVIRMFHGDHPPPHLDAEYQGHRAQIGLHPLVLRRGRLPPRVAGLVIEWTTMHRDALLRNWWLAQRRLPVDRVPPLE